MFGWLRRLLGGREEKMAKNEKKNVVGYSLVNDGLRPGEQAQSLYLRMPIEVELVPGQPQIHNIGVQFDRVAQLYPAKHLFDQAGLTVKFEGAIGQGPGALLPANTPVFVTLYLDPATRDHIRIEEKEAVAVAVFPPDVDEFRKNS